METGVHRLPLIESTIILVAVLSLMPLLFSFGALWYRVWLGVVLLAMVWVTVRRLSRTREAADEAKRKRDEAGRGGGPPWLR